MERGGWSSSVVIAGVFGLVGSLLGGAMALAGGLAVGRAQADATREREIRSERVSVYGDLIAEAYAYDVHLGEAWAAGLEVGDGGEAGAVAFQELRAILAGTSEEAAGLNSALARVHLVADQEVRAAADRLVGQTGVVLSALQPVATGAGAGSEPLRPLDGTWTPIGEGIVDFIDTARAETD